MKYKIMAVDMDGTLLNDKDEITPRTEEAIKSLVDKGVVFTLCTGRPLQGIKRYIDQLRLDCPVITYNGAVIVHSKTGQILFSQDMDTAEARRVYNLAKEKNAMFIVWSQNRLYASELSEKTEFYEDITSTKAALLEDFEKLLSDGITKMLWYESPEILDGYIEELKQAGFENTTFTKSRAYFLEFFSNRTSKALAMAKLGEYYGITKDEMIAAGDQTNDLPMIQYAGLGVAMGNAVDSVKAAADTVTDTNINEGVAQFIEKYLI